MNSDYTTEALLHELAKDWLLRLESSVVNGERVLWSLSLARRGTGQAPSHDYYGYDLSRVVSAAHAGQPTGRVA